MGHILQLGCCDGVNLCYQLVEASLLATMQEVFSPIEGKLLMVVGSYGELSLQLSLGSSQLSWTEWCLHDAIQFAVHQTDATLHIVMVATEIDVPYPRITIAGHRTFDGIYQPILFTQFQVQTGIHAWTAQYVVKQEEWHASLVVVAERLAPQHDVGLMVRGIGGERERW